MTDRVPVQDLQNLLTELRELSDASKADARDALEAGNIGQGNYELGRASGYGYVISRLEAILDKAA